ncbi:hypothetical protein [Streptomyces sp. 6N223]|uniref:hypothetical protein n=1 Tax=Streptomyces sp. 6N223 TaxID=3457412 RepID=UPI003FCF4C82
MAREVHHGVNLDPHIHPIEPSRTAIAGGLVVTAADEAEADVLVEWRAGRHPTDVSEWLP